MKTIHMMILAAMAFAVVCSPPPAGAAGSQDNWYYVTRWGVNEFNCPCGIAIGTNGLLYVADRNNSRIQVWDQSGNHVTNWGGITTPLDVAVSTNGRIFVASGDNFIHVFDHQGASITNWGGLGSGDGQFNQPSGVALTQTGLVVVADQGNSRMQVLDQDGRFIRKWGSAGSLDGQFGGTIGVVVGLDGLIYVGDMGQQRIHVFDLDGNFLRKFDPTGSWEGYLSIGKDGLFYVRIISPYVGVSDADGWSVGQITAPGEGVCDFRRVAETEDGTAYLTSESQHAIYVYKRAYRTMAPMARTAPPLPAVIRSEQRAGTRWMDIDYKVVDADSSHVAVGVLAYLNGGSGLDSIIKMNTFVDGTQTNLGPSVAANREHHLTWDVAADLNTNYVNLKVEVLAKDNRSLMGFDYVTIPSNGVNPALTISCIPVIDSDLMNVWAWLVATNDAAVNLVSGSLYGVQGAYSNQVLASGATTTSNGVSFVLERLNVRKATDAEVNRAKMASSPGVTNEWTPKNTVGGRPFAINEYGIDTSDVGTWVVPLP